MKNIILYFQAYVKNNILSMKWILFFSILFYALFISCRNRGWTKVFMHKVWNQICGLLLSIFCSFVFVMTLFRRTFIDGQTFKIEVFETYFDAFSGNNPELQLQIIMNIVMFIPIGFLLPCSFFVFERYRYVLLVVFICSISIEYIQGIIKIGFFEIVDVINNTLGAIIGVLIYILFIKLKKILAMRFASNSELIHKKVDYK